MGFGEESVAVLIQVLLNKERPVLGQRVGYLLGRIDSETESVVPALIQALVDTQSFVRSAAASSLGGLARMLNRKSWASGASFDGLRMPEAGEVLTSR
jgi:HEAT repeat protein